MYIYIVAWFDIFFIGSNDETCLAGKGQKFWPLKHGL